MKNKCLFISLYYYHVFTFGAGAHLWRKGNKGKEEKKRISAFLDPQFTLRQNSVLDSGHNKGRLRAYIFVLGKSTPNKHVPSQHPHPYKISSTCSTPTPLYLRISLTLTIHLLRDLVIFFHTI